MRKSEHSLPPDIKTRFRLACDALENDPHVVFGYLFGSYARGNPTPLSDVDIALYLDEVAEIGAAKLDLIGTITKALNTDEVDLVILNEAPLSLAGRIQMSAQVLVDKDSHRRFAYESLIRREFADFQVQEKKILFRRFGLGG